MKLEFAGSPEITTTREHLWARLLDPDFVGASAPGVEQVEVIDPTHFKVISGLGLGAVRVPFNLDVELFDIVEKQSIKMRAWGKAPGSVVEVISSLRLEDAGPGKVLLDWTATSDVSGAMAGIAPQLLEAAARKLTEEFWTGFARRAGSLSPAQADRGPR
jgi:carbon monoxide dehydrogenase subunit G